MPGGGTSALSTRQVLDIRYEFFIKLHSYTELQVKYGITAPTVRKAVHGHGRYAKITDDIPQEIKESRISRREKHSIRRIKKVYVRSW